MMTSRRTTQFAPENWFTNLLTLFLLPSGQALLFGDLLTLPSNNWYRTSLVTDKTFSFGYWQEKPFMWENIDPLVPSSKSLVLVSHP